MIHLRMGTETECTSQDVTMLLQRIQDAKVGSDSEGSGITPLIISNLFFALNAVINEGL